MGKFENKLTEGNVIKLLFKFSLPFLLSNMLQAMYNVSDTLVVSWFAGANTVSGVANGGQVTLLAMNFAIGFTVGGTILIGQYFGAGKREELSETIGTMFSVLAIMALILTAVVIIFCDDILTLIQIPEESFSEARIYMIICMCGTVFTFGYNAVAAILRGMGDSKNPLLFVLIAGAINTALDLPFVGLFHWDAAGDAASTVIAQAVSLVLAVVYLGKKGFVFEFRLKNFKICREKLKMLIKIGLPNSVQNVVVGLSFLLMMSLVNRYGVYASAAMGIVGKFNGFAILPAIAMSSSVSSMAAQNLGAGFIGRAKKTMFSGIMLALPIGSIFFLLAYFFPEAIMRIFTDEKPVIEEGLRYIKFFSLDYIFVSFTFCFNGLLMGAGRTTFTMINGMMSSILLRVPFALLFGTVLQMGLTGIGLAAPVATIGAGIVGFCYYLTGKWKENNIIAGPQIDYDTGF